jgi:hypothetical protein
MVNLTKGMIMIAAVLAAAILLSPAPPAASTTATQQTAPLREIVYKFSFDQTEERTIEDFGAPPQSSASSGGYSGTLTIDVLELAHDGSMLISVNEMTNATNQTKPNAAKVVVHPDGALTITEGTYDADMLVLLPYLATAFFGDHQLQEGNAWETTATTDKLATTRSYHVEKVDGDTATISCAEVQKGPSVHGSVLIRSRIVYKAPLLVPVVLNVQLSNDRSGQAATQTSRTIFNFQRTSDTRDK